MKTQFERDEYKFEPAHTVYYTAANGKLRLMRPWRKYVRQSTGIGNYIWVYQGTRFYPLRTSKREIL